MLIEMLLAITAAIPSPISELPGELQATFAPGYAVLVRVPVAAGSSVVIYGGYDNTQGSSTSEIRWVVRKGDAAPTTKRTEVPLSFRPVGMTARAGESNTLYMAGWSERAGGELVLERWTLVPPTAIGSTIHPVTGAEFTTANQPRVVREELARLDTVGPVWSLVCHPCAESDRLFLLEYLNPHATPQQARVWEYDVGQEALVDHDGDQLPDPLITEQDVAELVESKDLFTAMIDGVGFCVVGAPSPRWIPSWNENTWVVLIDDDKDGDFQPGFAIDTEIFLDAYPYESWEQEYEPCQP